MDTKNKPMNSPQIAVVTISLDEWNQLKATVTRMAEGVQKLTGKEEKELLTPKEVCEILKIGRTTYERYKANGIFEVTRVNRRKYSKNYVSRAHLEKLISEGVV
jgi:predicted glycosyltransferase